MKTILITGATSGIGLEYARYFSKKFENSKCKIIVTGRREKINDVKKELETDNVKIEIIKADFSKESDLKKLISKIKNEDIGILINNAGFGNNSGFFNDTFENQNAMIKTHINATTQITHEIAKKMISKKRGVIINVSSLAALLPVKNSELYIATKSYILLFTKSIAKELRNHNIKVQCLCPGFVKTDFSKRKNVNKKIIHPMNAKKVIRSSIKSLRKGKIVCIPGTLNKIIYHYLKTFK